MNREHRAYRRLYRFLRIILAPFYRFEAVGLENIPDGPAILCANHSSNFDPIMVSLAAGSEHHIRYMAKIELFKIPVVASVIAAIGAFPVDRGNKDIRAIKTALKILRSGDKIGIFPEGTRTKAAGDRAAKSGAIRLADQTGAPLVPVWLPRRKKPFRKIRVVFDTPYTVNTERRKLAHEDYVKLAEELMDRINALDVGPAAAKSAGEPGE
jgi:1-acyl-sn-glycerol-3-phosphate acyltransferase